MRTALSVCQAMIIAIAVVLPAPVAIFSARRISSGFASAFAAPKQSAGARAALYMTGLGDGVPVSVMHLAKGLEFCAVAVIACDQELPPLEARIAC
jgi:hypothetical protein